MNLMEPFNVQDKMRIIQEIVPGKQVTLVHIIANPDEVLYQKLGLDLVVDYKRSAIGIVTVTPSEAAIIAADVAMKTSGIEIGFVDRVSGTLIVTGTVSEVEAATQAITSYLSEKLKFTVCEVSRT